MRLALVTTPRRWQSRIPRLIPGAWPKSSALKITDALMVSRQPRLAKQPGGHLFRCEVLFGNAARRLAMPSIVAIDGLDRGNGLLHGAEGEQPFSEREDPAQAGVLSDHRFARGQVARIPLAEPTAAEPDVLILGDGEFRARILEVPGVRAEDVERHRYGRHQPPAPRGQELTVPGVLGGHRQLERLRGSCRQPGEALPFQVLAPVVDFTAVFDVVAGLAVVADGGEEPGRRIIGHGPEIEVDRLPGLPVLRFEPVQGHPAVVSAEVLP